MAHLRYNSGGDNESNQRRVRCRRTMEIGHSNTDDGESTSKNENKDHLPHPNDHSQNNNNEESDQRPMVTGPVDPNPNVKFGFASVCGARREMEDAVTVHPSLRWSEDEVHYFGVYDGHGCSHVAYKCMTRLHELVKEELESRESSTDWRRTMERSFCRMDKEVLEEDRNVTCSKCRSRLKTLPYVMAGSTAVVSVITPNKIIVANCGDSRAVLCSNNHVIALSHDQKPDRPDEKRRIQEAGGQVLNLDGARVSGILAMSRAIGDEYLKPYVIPEPEVKVIDRQPGDEFLILASDGLWDVVANKTACGVVRKYLRDRTDAAMLMSCDNAGGDKNYAYASSMLTRLALNRKTTDNVSAVVVNLKD